MGEGRRKEGKKEGRKEDRKRQMQNELLRGFRGSRVLKRSHEMNCPYKTVFSVRFIVA